MSEGEVGMSEGEGWSDVERTKPQTIQNKVFRKLIINEQQGLWSSFDRMASTSKLPHNLVDLIVISALSLCS